MILILKATRRRTKKLPFSLAAVKFCNSIGRDTRCDKSLRHVAATGCCNKSPRVTCKTEPLSLRSVARIQTSLNQLCDRSQRQNKHKQPCRSVSADETTCRRDVSRCASAAMCLGLICFVRHQPSRLKLFQVANQCIFGWKNTFAFPPKDCALLHVDFLSRQDVKTAFRSN